MYKIHCLKYNFFTNYNNLNINLKKLNYYPSDNNLLIKNIYTYILVNSGKLILELNNSINDKNKILYAEKKKLYETTINKDKLLINNKYVLIINPNIYYSFLAFENSNFTIFHKLNFQNIQLNYNRLNYNELNYNELNYNQLNYNQN